MSDHGKFCGNCGSQRQPNALFCTSCGQRFAAAAPAAEVIVPPSEPPLAPAGWYLGADQIQWYWDGGTYTHRSKAGVVQPVGAVSNSSESMHPSGTTNIQRAAPSNPAAAVTSVAAGIAVSGDSTPTPAPPDLVHGPDYEPGADCSNCGFPLEDDGTCTLCDVD